MTSSPRTACRVPVPFAAAAPLYPVRTTKHLREIGKRFKNCLYSAHEVGEGWLYYYVWEGEEPAILSIRRI